MDKRLTNKIDEMDKRLTVEISSLREMVILAQRTTPSSKRISRN